MIKTPIRNTVWGDFLDADGREIHAGTLAAEFNALGTEIEALRTRNLELSIACATARNDGYEAAKEDLGAQLDEARLQHRITRSSLEAHVTAAKYNYDEHTKLKAERDSLRAQSIEQTKTITALSLKAATLGDVNGRQRYELEDLRGRHSRQADTIQNLQRRAEVNGDVVALTNQVKNCQTANNNQYRMIQATRVALEAAFPGWRLNHTDEWGQQFAAKIEQLVSINSEKSQVIRNLEENGVPGEKYDEVVNDRNYWKSYGLNRVDEDLYHKVRTERDRAIADLAIYKEANERHLSKQSLIQAILKGDPTCMTTS